jgi:ABC-type multidrug transport system fused ATPase/permease subunit
MSIFFAGSVLENRAFLQDAPILIMDEAVSNLDTENERLLQTAIHKIKEGRTTILVAHRPSTIQSADRIVAIDGGNLIAILKIT